MARFLWGTGRPSGASAHQRERVICVTTEELLSSAVRHHAGPAAFGDLPVRRVQLLVVLLAVVAGCGLFLDVYRDETAFARNAYRGADLVSVLLAVPLLLLALRSARRGSVRGLLLLLGGLAYIAYQYAYTFAYGWSRLFPIYLTLLALSAFTLAEMLIRIDPHAVADRFYFRARVVGVARFLFVIGLGLGLMEGLQVLVAVVTGNPPPIVAQTGHPTSPVYILDLGLIVPMMLLASRWLGRRRPWGFVAASVLLVKGVTVGLGLLAANALAVLAKTTTDGPLNFVWLLIAAGSGWALVLLLRQVRPATSTDL